MPTDLPPPVTADIISILQDGAAPAADPPPPYPAPSRRARRLRRLAHRVIWVNPHAGAGGYRPVQSGIAAALPHLDSLVAGHSLAALETLLAEVRDA